MCDPLLLFGFSLFFSGWESDAFALQGFAYQFIEGFCPVEVIQYFLHLLALLCPPSFLESKGVHDFIRQVGGYLVD